MKFTVNNNDFKENKSDCIVLGVFKSNIFSLSAENINIISQNSIMELLSKRNFSGDIGETLLLHDVSEVVFKKILIIGCGRSLKISLKNYKKLLQILVDFLKKIKCQKVLLCLTELFVIKKDIYWKVRIIIELITNNNYSFNKFKTVKKNVFKLLTHIVLNVQDEYELKIGKIAVKHALAISLGVNETKNLANMPPNICTPLYLSQKVNQLSQKYKNIVSEIINYEDIKKLGMLAYASVGRGSINKPYLSIINYKGDTVSNSKPIILIGKGVTFDSGGISIKPSYNMHEMKYDMSGAAVVYGTMITISELNLPLNVVGVLASSENMLSGSSYRPGDILQTMSGKTVEILDTDAEGRLILCDVLTFVEKFSPELVIDIATLTGSCVVALGHIASGLLSNNNDLIRDLSEAGEITDDKVWQLPMFSDYKKELRSNVADIRNIGSNSAGAITAACFLSFFAKNYKWAHLDIAGTAWISGKNSYSTGRPVTLLSQFLLKKALTNIDF